MARTKGQVTLKALKFDIYLLTLVTTWSAWIINAVQTRLTNCTLLNAIITWGKWLFDILEEMRVACKSKSAKNHRLSFVVWIILPAISSIALAYVRAARKLRVLEAGSRVLDIATSIIVSENSQESDIALILEIVKNYMKNSIEKAYCHLPAALPI